MTIPERAMPVDLRKLTCLSSRLCSAPPGQRIDVGGYCVHITCTGEGAPTVVMDAGLTSSSLLWSAVLPRVGSFTRVCAFDRPGYAWSDPVPPDYPCTSRQIVTELRTALRQSGLEPPYVLVGHSFGGLNMLLYTLDYPTEVVGLVLVDSSHPEQSTRVPGILSIDRTVKVYRTFIALARWGVLKRLGPMLQRKMIPGWRNLSADKWAAHLEFASQPAHYEAALREAMVGAQSCAEVRAASRSLGDLPLVVLTAGAWASGRSTRMKQAMVTLHRELADLSSNSKHTIPQHSSHMMPADQPDAVTDAIRYVIDVVRQRAQAN